MFKIYERFKFYEKMFNVTFATTVAGILVLIFGIYLVEASFFDGTYKWTLLITMIFIPIMVFLAISGNMEFQVAYYRVWIDKNNGMKDRRKILREIKNKKINAEQKIRVETDYSRKLIGKRDLILSEIKQEYFKEKAKKEECSIEFENKLKNIRVELDLAKKMETEAYNLMKAAKTSGEIYQQRQEHERKVVKTGDLEMAKNDILYKLEQVEQEKNDLRKKYEEIIYRIDKIYRVRYVKYMEIVIRGLENVKNLRYTMSEMPILELEEVKDDER